MKETLTILIGNRSVILRRCRDLSNGPDSKKYIQGYYLGQIMVGDTNYHVEAIQIKRSGDALNDDYQNRIDAWQEINQEEVPQTVTVGGLKFFINIEPWAR